MDHGILRAGHGGLRTPTCMRVIDSRRPGIGVRSCTAMLRPPCLDSQLLPGLGPQEQFQRHVCSRSRRKAGRGTARAAATATATAIIGQGPSPGLAAFANSLGYLVFAVACVRGFPQISKILKARSAEGVSLVSYIVETLCYTTTFAYHFRNAYPFLAYGELSILLLQNGILMALILYYNDKLADWRTGVGSAAYAAFTWGLLSGAIPMSVLKVMQASVIFIIGLGGRVPQILLNFRRGNSGQLSFLTNVINLAGNITRLFTTVVLMGDKLVMGSNISQGVLNSILMYQTAVTALQRRGKQKKKEQEQQRGLDPGGAGAAAA